MVGDSSDGASLACYSERGERIYGFTGHPRTAGTHGSVRDTAEISRHRYGMTLYLWQVCAPDAADYVRRMRFAPLRSPAVAADAAIQSGWRGNLSPRYDASLRSIVREVTVSARAFLVFGVFAVSLSVSANPPKPPSSDEIATAVRQLGDSRYTVREQATKKLWLAGADAEAALREALKSRDPEVARRARELLDKIEWGIFADTPDEVVALVEKYRAGDPTVQAEAVRGLVKARRPGLTVLARIGHRVPAEARPALAKAMTDAAREVVPQLLASRDYGAAGELLETCVASGIDAALTDYAAFVLLQGQLDAAIARRQSESPPRPAALAVLFRAKGDLASARKYAHDAAATDEGLLLDEILWEQGDWAELAKRPVPEGLQPTVHRGTTALLHHLAGNTKALDADLAELRHAIKANEGWVVPPRTPPAGDAPPPPDPNLLFLAWTAAKT